MATIREDLLDKIAAFSKESGLSERDVGKRAVNSEPCVRRLRAGRDIRLSTAQRISDFIDGFYDSPMGDMP